MGLKPKIIWLTGLSGSGKTSIATSLYYKLTKETYKVVLLDGDDIRQYKGKSLSFSDSDRKINMAYTANLAKQLYDVGQIVICSLISPFKLDRDYMKKMIKREDFLEVYVKCPLEVCKERDPKKLYSKDIPNFTGISSVYEEPNDPDLCLDTTKLPVEVSVERLYGRLKD